MDKKENEFGVIVLKALQGGDPSAWIGLYPSQQEYKAMLQSMLDAKVGGLTQQMIDDMLKEREKEFDATYRKEFLLLQQKADSLRIDWSKVQVQKFDYIAAPAENVNVKYLTGHLWFGTGLKQYVIHGIEAMEIGGVYRLQAVKGIEDMSGGQIKTAAVAGEYYLRGVMETAAGIKLNADSSFEFFYSYGALDRQGAGKWTIDDGAIILNSTHAAARDFLLKEARRAPGNNMTIGLKDVPSSIIKYFHITVSDGGKVVHGTANDSGKIVLPMMKAAEIGIFFEWCPEKKSTFKIQDPSANSFTFQLLPSITDVTFDHMRMKMEEGVITGMLPFTRGEMYKFVKNE